MLLKATFKVYIRISLALIIQKSWHLYTKIMLSSSIWCYPLHQFLTERSIPTNVTWSTCSCHVELTIAVEMTTLYKIICTQNYLFNSSLTSTTSISILQTCHLMFVCFMFHLISNIDTNLPSVINDVLSTF